MARITKAEQALIPNVTLFMNGELLQKIDQDEVSDRVHYAKQLMTKAAATNDPVLRQSWNKLAGAVLQAPKPRTEIEKQVEDLRTKAKLSWNAVSAAGLRDEADRVLAANPVAPRRQQAVRMQLAKAAADGLVAVYDKNGELVGLTDPAKVIPVVDMKSATAKTGDGDTAGTLAAEKPLGTPKTPPSAATPAAAGMPDEVAKAAKPHLRGIVVRRPL